MCVAWKVSGCLDRLFALVVAHMWRSVDGAAIVGTEFTSNESPWLPWVRAITVSGQLELFCLLRGSWRSGTT
jgi:hypothetical protein